MKGDYIMGFASKFNKSVKFNYETPEGLAYASLKELYEANGADKVYTVHALYINTKGKYGDAPLAITDDAQVNLPSHLTEVANEIRQDAEAVAQINNGKFGFKIYPYSGKNGNGYSVEWVDIG